MSRYDFFNRVAIVTGAGEGIGYEIARQLAASGANVLLNDIDSDAAKQAVDQIGPNCESLAGDAGDLAHVQALIDDAVARWGRLDFAVANAGLTIGNPFLEFSPAQMDQLLAVNLKGSFFLAQAAAKQIMAQKTSGRILFMSSVCGHQAVPELAAYGMTKAGLEFLARALSNELGPQQITVNAIAPGATITPRNIRDDPDYKASWSGVIPVGRCPLPEDMASAALYLLSDEASRVTGQTIVVDGGWTGVAAMPSDGS